MARLIFGTTPAPPEPATEPTNGWTKEALIRALDLLWERQDKEAIVALALDLLGYVNQGEDILDEVAWAIGLGYARERYGR